MHYILFPHFLCFFFMDENRTEKWSVAYATMNSLAACMIAFILCDFWRLSIGVLHNLSENKVPFVHAST